jgi:hypothetical protein
MTELNLLTEDRPPHKPTRWVTDKTICERYDIHRFTLYRWRRDPKMGFPKPADINGRNRTLEGLLDEFDRRLGAAASKSEELR